MWVRVFLIVYLFIFIEILFKEVAWCQDILPGMLPDINFPVQKEISNKIASGQWVEYKIFHKPQQTEWIMNFSIIEKTDSGWWLEFLFRKNYSGQLLIKILTEGNIYKVLQMKRCIVQPDEKVPLELPVKDNINKDLKLINFEGVTKYLGNEKLKYRNEFMETKHYFQNSEKNKVEAWFSSKVPIWGLVKFDSPRIYLELKNFGFSALSQLKGEPIPFDPEKNF